jgi:DNA-binding MurR/RpiR family transcriptional regulator
MELLADPVARDVASLTYLLARHDPEMLARAAKRLERADTVELIGQLRSAPVVELVRNVATMPGKRTLQLDVSGGLAIYVAKATRLQAGAVLRNPVVTGP